VSSRPAARTRRTAPRGEPGEPGPGTVVVVSASVGGGHDGAAREFARRLREHGFDVRVHDFLTVLPGRVGPAMRTTYQVMASRVPWFYGMLYRTVRHHAWRWLVRTLLAPARRRMLRLIPPDVAAVVSVYPLASHTIGELRRRGRLDAPTITYLTDFSVHALWVAAGIDQHCALHLVSARQASRLGASGVLVGGPAVSPAFAPAGVAARRAARVELGLPPAGRLALLVAGSWGVGAVERAAVEIARTGIAAPVVVCGRNAELRERLGRRGLPLVLGWVEDMPTLLRAADVVVENAGGLTSLEAMASGVPVLTYRPFPGHGRTNAAAMAEAGVTAWVRRPDQLGPALVELLDGPRGRRQVAAGLALVGTDPTPMVLAAASRPVPVPLAVHRAVRTRAAVAGVALIVALGWNATAGARLAVQHGFHTVPRAREGVYLIVHPGDRTDLDPATVRRLGADHAAVAVDADYARRHGASVSALVAAGLAPVNAGPGPPYQTGIVGGRADIRRAASAVRKLTGRTPQLYLSGPDVDAVDVSMLSLAHEAIVLPDLRVNPDDGAYRLRPGMIVLIECDRVTDCRIGALLTALEEQARALPAGFDSLEELAR
jgi:processive 1,2-diacylglycerol beta-glucosyltransferase